MWAYPGCPIRILLSLSVIEQLQAEVSRSASGQREIGGLLVRSRRTDSNLVRIVDYIPLTGDRKASEPLFKVPPDALAEAIARCPSDSKVAGYYRTGIDQRVHLRPDDLETIKQWFNDPANVFLVIAAGGDGRQTAGFFFWQDAAVAAHAGLTFPFAAAKLVSEGWPIDAEPLRTERSGNGFFRDTGDRLKRLTLPVKIVIVSVLFALLIGIRLFTWNRSASGAKAAPSLGLQVSREGTRFMIAWNPSSPAIANAKDATLVIWDPSRQTWDASSAPLYVPLTSAQLHAGSMNYSSFSFAEKVRFRLDAVGGSGDTASESMISIAAAPGPAASSPATLAPPLQNAPAPYDRRRSTFPKPRNKNFVPPQAPRTATASRIGDATVPDPPKIPSDPSVHPTLPQTATQPAAAPQGAPQGTRLTVAPPNGQSNNGVVTITSEPSGARVEINGVAEGVTPVTLQISPQGLGFSISVSKNGYLKWTVQSFSAAEPFSLHAQLRLLPK